MTAANHVRKSCGDCALHIQSISRLHSTPLRSAPLHSAPLRSTPAPLRSTPPISSQRAVDLHYRIYTPNSPAPPPITAASLHPGPEDRQASDADAGRITPCTLTWHPVWQITSRGVASYIACLRIHTLGTYCIGWANNYVAGMY